MAERSDGRWRDAGDGLKPIVALAGIAAEGKAQSAYRAYLDHTRDCEECPQSLFQCETAASLWKLYREARG